MRNGDDAGDGKRLRVKKGKVDCAHARARVLTDEVGRGGGRFALAPKSLGRL